MHKDIVTGHSDMCINRKFKKGHCQFEKLRMTHPFCTYFNCLISVPKDCDNCKRNVKPQCAKEGY